MARTQYNIYFEFVDRKGVERGEEGGCGVRCVREKTNIPKPRGVESST